MYAERRQHLRAHLDESEPIAGSRSSASGEDPSVSQKQPYTSHHLRGDDVEMGMRIVFAL
jgi:hypothetical protein